MNSIQHLSRLLTFNYLKRVFFFFNAGKKIFRLLNTACCFLKSVNRQFSSWREVCQTIRIQSHGVRNNRIITYRDYFVGIHRITAEGGWVLIIIVFWRKKEKKKRKESFTRGGNIVYNTFSWYTAMLYE